MKITTPKFADLLLAVCIVLLLEPAIAFAQTNAADRLEQIRNDPARLRLFLQEFPKGGDLHNHSGGSVYAENYIKWSAEDGKCVILETSVIVQPPCDAAAGRPSVDSIRLNSAIVNPLIDAFSVRNYARRPVSGHNQFFSTFFRFRVAAEGRFGDIVAELAARAARQNLLYLELLQSWAMPNALLLPGLDDSIRPGNDLAKMLRNERLDKIVTNAISETDEADARRREILKCGSNDADPGCDVEVRYLAQVIRTMPPNQVLAQTLLAFRLVDADPRYVGLNFVAPEDHPVALRDYRWHMQLIGALAKLLPNAADGITLHAGELALGLVPPEDLGWHIREAIDVAQAKRIGHGTDITFDRDAPDLLRQMARQKILVEINLTSADVILDLQGDEHPYRFYRDYGVPMALSADDEGVSRIDLTHEYQRAVETFDIDYRELKQLSRNSLEYSFLSGRSLFADISEAAFVADCERDVGRWAAPSTTCAQLLRDNDKARVQWLLEQRLAEFETRFE